MDPVHLNAKSVRWAITFVLNHSDGDLFPRLREFEVIHGQVDHFTNLVEQSDLSRLSPGPSRRFIVPKDEISYRQATQLDPQDSIILSALIYQHGQAIEDRRLDRNIVFSYRFKPSRKEGLYSGRSSWNEYWEMADHLAEQSSHVLKCDISDFYNQIYHHTIEQQLIESQFPNQAIKWIINLFSNTTAKVSRGIPIGPHAAHLIAESTLIPIDNTLVAYGLKFIRFVDDILVFVESEGDARLALFRIATALDKQQRLMLQKHKTQILTATEFRALCKKMVEDRPINSDEESLLRIVKKYSGGNPYKTISYETMKKKHWKLLSEENISSIIDEYLDEPEPDYIRLRWFYRRLSQIGHPGAVSVSLERIGQLGPCFAQICSYFASLQSVTPEKWNEIGIRLLNLLNTGQVRESEFFRLSILSLFSINSHLDHFEILASLYKTSDQFVRREIILVGFRNGFVDWLRQYKEDFDGMDPWQKRAFLLSCSKFSSDERKSFLRGRNFGRPLEDTLCKWART